MAEIPFAGWVSHLSLRVLALALARVRVSRGRALGRQADVTKQLQHGTPIHMVAHPQGVWVLAPQERALHVHDMESIKFRIVSTRSLVWLAQHSQQPAASPFELLFVNNKPQKKRPLAVDDGR